MELTFKECMKICHGELTSNFHLVDTPILVCVIGFCLLTIYLYLLGWWILESK